MFKFEKIGTIGDLEIQKMSDASGKSYVKMTKLIDNKPTQQSVVIPFENVQKLIDLLNDAVLYSSGDVGYSDASPAGYSTETRVPVKFLASVGTAADLANDKIFDDHWGNNLDRQQVRDEFEIVNGVPYSGN